MISTLFRVLAGFAMACLVVGLTKVAFVITPAELSKLSGQALSDRLGTFGVLSLLAATHSAIFAAPFALIAMVIGEWQSIRNPMYFATAGVAIALAGFFAQYSSETGAAGSIANNYALKAFLTAGFAGGLAYWMVAGRAAGDVEAEVEPVTTPKVSVRPTTSVPVSGPSSKSNDIKSGDVKSKSNAEPSVAGLATKAN